MSAKAAAMRAEASRLVQQAASRLAACESAERPVDPGYNASSQCTYKNVTLDFPRELEAPLNGKHTPGWGLPTEVCGSWTRYLVQDYPTDHHRWRKQGRILVHCSKSAGIGDYLRSLPAALVFSMLTHMAITFNCDLQLYDQNKAVRSHHLLSTYFKGPHFNWWFKGNLPQNATKVDFAAHPPLAWGRSWEPFPEGTGGVRIRTNRASDARRLLLRNKQWTSRVLGADFVHTAAEQNVHGCLLRYLLQPTQRLRKAVHASIRLAPVPHTLLAIAAFHVRLGDFNFYHNGSVQSLAAARLVRVSAFTSNPVAALRCVEKLSQLPEAGCLPILVMSDSSATRECARKMLRQPPIFTAGNAVHLASSPEEAKKDPRDVEKIFVDWIVLAQSRLLLSFGSSGFADTAASYALASAPNSLRLRFPWLRHSYVAQSRSAAKSRETQTLGWWEKECRLRLALDQNFDGRFTTTYSYGG